MFDFDAARRLPPRIRFGCSSWKYPGWKGQVYLRDYSSKTRFEAECIAEYGAFPWFRAVGLDHCFYRPPTARQLQSYASQTPADLQWLPKVWDRITVPHYGRAARYGDRAGEANPDFLDPVLFRERFLEAFEQEDLLRRTGPLIFQFQDIGRGRLSDADFLDRLEGFLQQLSGRFRVAVEIRTPTLLQDRYFGVLNDAGATHVFNHWSAMPPLVEQMRAAARAGGLLSDFYVARLLTPRGVSYRGAVERFSPYERLQEEQPAMRRDVQRLLRRGLERDVDTYVLVNNRVEGNAPTTIDGLGRALLSSLED